MRTKSAEEIAFLEAMAPEQREAAEALTDRVDKLKAEIEGGMIECWGCGRTVRMDRNRDNEGWTAECLCGWQVAGLRGGPKH